MKKCGSQRRRYIRWAALVGSLVGMVLIVRKGREIWGRDKGEGRWWEKGGGNVLFMRDGVESE